MKSQAQLTRVEQHDVTGVGRRLQEFARRGRVLRSYRADETQSGQQLGKNRSGRGQVTWRRRWSRPGHVTTAVITVVTDDDEDDCGGGDD